MASKSVPFRSVRKLPFEIKVGDSAGGSYKVTSIKSVKWLQRNEFEIIGMCREVEKK